MTIYTRPNEIVFAESAKSGEVIDFPDIARGWGITFEETDSQPPMEWFNALTKQQFEAVRYLMQRGVSEWSATEDYPVNALVQFEKQFYVSLQVNKGQNPKNSVENWISFDSKYAAKEHVHEQYRLKREFSAQVFTTSGIFTVPSGVTDIYISGCGGGGGGGAGSGSPGRSSSVGGGGGGGGGAGQSIQDTHYTVTEGQTINITIGAGGVGGLGSTSIGSSGRVGGNTIIENLITLSGGSGGGFGGAPTGSNLVGGGGAGGPGGGGYPAGSYGSDGNYQGNGGVGASSPFGGGGAGIRASTASFIASGGNAGGFGAGGGGSGGIYGTVASASGNGGAGTNGFVKITW